MKMSGKKGQNRFSAVNSSILGQVPGYVGCLDAPVRQGASNANNELFRRRATLLSGCIGAYECDVIFMPVLNPVVTDLD